MLPKPISLKTLPRTKIPLPQYRRPPTREQASSNKTSPETDNTLTRNSMNTVTSTSSSRADFVELDNQIEKRYDVKNRLGKGAYGIVWKADDMVNGETIALKKIFDAFQNEVDAQRTYREIVFLHEFGKHPNIIPLINTHRATNDLDIYLTFPLMSTDLHKVVSNTPDKLSDTLIRQILYQILKAIKYIHSADVIHRDLKPANILLDENYNAKVADFGLARSLNVLDDDITEDRVNPLMTEYVATRWYRAPELLFSFKGYSKAVDMWSIGCILGEMITHRALFPGNNTVEQIELVIKIIANPEEGDADDLCSTSERAIVDAVLKEEKTQSIAQIVADYYADDDTIDLLEGLLVFHPSRRLTVDEVLDHNFLAKFRNESEEFTLDHLVYPPVSDNTRLTVDDYRQVIYDAIQGKRFSSAVPPPNITPRSSLIPVSTISKSTIGMSTVKARNISVHTLPKKPPGNTGLATKGNPAMENANVRIKIARSTIAFTHINPATTNKPILEFGRTNYVKNARNFQQQRKDQVENGTLKTSRRTLLPWESEKTGAGEWAADFETHVDLTPEETVESNPVSDPYAKLDRLFADLTERKKVEPNEHLELENPETYREICDQNNYNDNFRIDHLDAIVKSTVYGDNPDLPDKPEKIVNKVGQSGLSLSTLPKFNPKLRSNDPVASKPQNPKPNFSNYGSDNKFNKGRPAQYSQTRCSTPNWNQNRDKGIAFSSGVPRWDPERAEEKKVPEVSTQGGSRGRGQFRPRRMVYKGNAKEKTQNEVVQNKTPWNTTTAIKQQNQFLTHENNYPPSDAHLTRYPFPSNYFPNSNNSNKDQGLPGFRGTNNKRISYDYSKAHGTINASELAELKHFER